MIGTASVSEPGALRAARDGDESVFDSLVGLLASSPPAA
jgi:hypothetical protein